MDSINEKFKVLDTNIILLNAQNIIELGQNATIVLPSTVIQEVDKFKSDIKSEVGFQAREFARMMEASELVDIIRNSDATVIIMKYQGILIYVTSLNKYSSEINDEKIIDVAEYYSNSGENQDSEFYTQDINCKFLAIARGINTLSMKLVEDVDLEFIKEFQIKDSEVFRTVHNANIYRINPNHKVQYHNYIFYNKDTNQKKLAIIVDDQINIISKEAEKELRNQKFQRIPPLNAEQLMMSKAIQDPRIDIIICEAQAGSGKTVTALSNAMRLIDLKEYTGITYLRNPINDEEAGEDVGYLSGNDEKLALYTGSAYDAIYNIAERKFQKSKLKGPELKEAIQQYANELLSTYDIQIDSTTGYRGKDIKKRVLILDEWQNASNGTSQKILTRVGEGCKVIVIGSNRQIDNKYLTKYNNGMSTLLEAATEKHTLVNLYAVNLHKVLRGPIVEFAEAIYSKKKNYS